MIHSLTAKKTRRWTPGMVLILYLLLWFGGNLLFLEDFPFMHTDESWLSGLSREMMDQGRPDATEPFYDLHERNPHAIKILYHFCQIAFIRLGGYSLLTVRLLSLTAGLLCLLLFYGLMKQLLPPGESGWFALLGVLWMSLDIQFLYASHTARQEILLTALMLAVLWVIHRGKGAGNGALAGVLTGLAAGFHPNAFIIAWPAGLLLLGQIAWKRRALRSGVSFLLAAGLTASLFVVLSFRFNPDFLRDYGAYGAPLGVLDAPDVKILRWPRFYRKIFQRIGGTYYLPDIRWQFYSLPAFLLLQLLPGSRKGILPAGLIGINIGLLLLGKYSQPSIVFLIPFYYTAAVLGFRGLWKFLGGIAGFLILVCLGTTLFFSVREIRRELHPSRERYSAYLTTIRDRLPPDSRVLGSLHLEYHLQGGNLYHWRNLEALPRQNGDPAQSPFAAYIRTREIDYIVLPAEIPYIYETRPTWNVLYGNPAHWYPQMEDFLERHCRLTARFPSPGYGTRIAAYRHSREWPIEIYKVMPEDSR